MVVRLLVRPSRQEDRRSDASALELSFVPQGSTGQGGDRHGRGHLGFDAEARGDAGFVVVLQKPQQLRLVAQVGAQVLTDTAGVLGHDSVVEPLVVAEVEALVLQLRLHVPVRLRDQHGVGMLRVESADHVRPELARPARRRLGVPRLRRTPG